MTITSMDNPGWDVQIDVQETVLSGSEIGDKFEGYQCSSPVTSIPCRLSMTISLTSLGSRGVTATALGRLAEACPHC